MTILRWLNHLVAPTGPTDEQLMWRVHHTDDHAAFTDLMERWHPRIHALCVRMTGDRVTADDLALGTFERVFARRGEYRATARFSTYLWRIAVNLCHDELRRRRVRGEGSGPSHEGSLAPSHGDPDATPAEGVLPSPDPGPDSLAATADEGAIVRAAMQRLSEPLRAVLVLRHYEGLKLREIAEVLSVPEGTVNSRMAEALNQLARDLAPRLRDAPSTTPSLLKPDFQRSRS